MPVLWFARGRRIFITENFSHAVLMVCLEDALLPEGIAHPFGRFELYAVVNDGCTTCGSQHAFASGQILNPYVTNYRQPFAISTILYPLTQRVALRLPCLRAEARGQMMGLTTFPELPTRAVLSRAVPIHLGSTFSEAVR